MIPLWLLAFQVAGGDMAELAKQGGTIYAMQCAVPYCHGSQGTAGRAPALAGKAYERAPLRNIIANGTRTGMPAFHSVLDASLLDAVVAYVLSLPALSSAPAPTPSKPAGVLSQQQTAGRDLFFDSERMPSCSACHSARGQGSAIAKPLTAASVTTVEALRQVPEVSVFHVKLADEPAFAGLLIRRDGESIRVIDLQARLPVVRTLDARRAILSASRWSHQRVTDRYQTGELQTIITFLKAADTPTAQ